MWKALSFRTELIKLVYLSMRQYVRLSDEWVKAIGLRSEEYGTHSPRWTRDSIIYKTTGNIRVIQVLLGIPRSRTLFATSALT